MERQFFVIRRMYEINYGLIEKKEKLLWNLDIAVDIVYINILLFEVY